MSRVGKQLLEIPKETTVNVSGSTVTVKGPQGELSRSFTPKVNIIVENERVSFAPKKEDDLESRALWGTYAAHVANMIAGVNKPFKKQLIVEGVGFRADVAGSNLVMSLGFSHKVELPIPKGLKVTSEKNVITISGIDIEEVGRFAAYVRDQKKPEPYKGKGIRYKTEVVRRKEGKKSA
ncbi:MAG TPA: 50S ribosomal protein L6 [Candidatus Paceibacterota bacterium]|nr:50S ribosomal protein L6 [Candidatus Paceibacterota bacterium]